MTDQKPTLTDTARTVRAARGNQRTAKSWGAEAAKRMLMNNPDPEVAEHIGQAPHLVGERGAGDAPLVPRLALPQQRHPVAVPRLHMALHAVLRPLQPAPRGPLRDRPVLPVLHPPARCVSP